MSESGLPQPADAEPVRRKRATQKWRKKGVDKNNKLPKKRRVPRPPAKKRPTQVVAVRLDMRIWDAIDKLAEFHDTDRTTVIKRFFKEGLTRYDNEELKLAESAGLKDSPFEDMPKPEQALNTTFPGKPEPEEMPMALPPSNVALLPQSAPLPSRREHAS